MSAIDIFLKERVRFEDNDFMHFINNNYLLTSLQKFIVCLEDVAYVPIISGF